MAYSKASFIPCISPTTIARLSGSSVGSERFSYVAVNKRGN
jgi:hypothetical protein